MAFIDYYKIMGVDKGVSQAEIRTAYKRRAKQFHPDLHPDDPKAKAKFQALNEAYDVLNDPEKRRKYDQYGEHWQQAEAFGGGAGWGNGSGASWSDSFSGFDFSQFAGGENGGFSSFFESLFGAAGRQGAFRRGASRQSQPQADMNIVVTIDLYTALLGGEIILQTQGGKLKLRVKPETQNGAKVRLRGKGYGRADGTYGDLIVTYAVKLPTNLTERQKELLREMQRQ